jgi:hypothetical protein
MWVVAASTIPFCMAMIPLRLPTWAETRSISGALS